MTGKFSGNKGGSWRSQRTISAKEDRTSPDGIVHRSKAECKRWNQLKLLQQGGHIRNLRREVKYLLEFSYASEIDGDPIWLRIKSRKGRIRTYTADFVYEKCQAEAGFLSEYGKHMGDGWFEIIEDVKGFLDGGQELRIDVFEAIYGVKVFINKV